MSIFDCPIARCELMRTLVVTDQTQTQCAHENGCPPGVNCPLASCFSGLEWAEAVPADGAGVPTAVDDAAAPRKRRRAAADLPKVKLAA